MKNKIIITLICFILHFKSSQLEEESIYYETIENIGVEIDKIIDNLSILNNKTIEDCVNIMREAYQGENYLGFLTKLFYDSSPSFEDIKNYYNCYNTLYMYVENDILDKLTYVVIKYHDAKNNNDSYTQYERSFNSFSKIFGICVPQNCSDEAYYTIIKLINNDYTLINGTIKAAINLKPKNDYSIKEILFQSLIPFLMITFILLVIEIRFISGIFWSIFGCFFRICNKNKYGKDNINKILKKRKLNQIDTLNGFINLNSNMEEVMPGSKESQISNENGLQIVVGLRGIFIIGLFLGLTLQNIFIAPTRTFQEKEYRRYMSYNLYCLLFFFARISQKMLYALSGFELTYKLLFYFDNQLYKKYISSGQEIDLNNMNLNKYVEDPNSNNNSLVLSPKTSKENINNKSKNNLENSNQKNSFSSKNTGNKKSKTKELKSFKSQSINDEYDEDDDNEESEEYELIEESDDSDEDAKKSSNLISKERKKSNEISKNNTSKKNKTNTIYNKSSEIIPKKFVSSIERRKIYLNNHDKLTFQTLLSFHLRQSYLYFIFIFSIIYYIFWQTKYFSYKMETGSLWMIMASDVENNFKSEIILSTIFLFAGTCNSLNYYYNFFIPAMNKIFFYLFGSTLIYYYYKKNSRLDISLIIIILITLISKLIIYLIFKDDEKSNFEYQPSLDFMQKDNYFFIQMHLLNLSYYCIGMFAGLANYSLQNDAKKKNIVKEFVKLPRKLYFIIKRKYNFLFGIFVFIIFSICDIFLYKLYMATKEQKVEKGRKPPHPNLDLEYFKSLFINIFNLFDCEIIIICIFIASIIIFYSSFSFLRDHFNSYPWKILSRIYFPLLLISYKHSNWFFFQFAERIDFSFRWVCFVLTLIFILSIVRSIVIYVFIQVPLKKITKIIYVENNIIIDELNKLKNSDTSGTLSRDETSSIDLSANTRCYVNGRKQSHDSNEDDNIIKNNYDLESKDSDNTF